ncbi:MAG TPA: TolC family protein, partial [Bryobacteraceae bacterium]|nr:TolC family protein [Bryobacteraceae bacterium]
LTLERALALAEQYNPQLRAAMAQTEGARAGILTARARPNPDVIVGAGRQRATRDSAIPGPGQLFSFNQPLELPAVRRSRIQAAEEGRTSSEFALSEMRLAVRAAVQQTFYQVLRRKGEVELARENLKLIEDLQRRIQVQVKVGEAARLELVRADAEVATARLSVRSAQLQLVNAISALRAAINAPQGESLDPQGKLDPAAILPPLNELREEVLARHPALSQAQAEIRRSAARLENERALRMPQPSLRADFERQPDLSLFRFGISLPLPLWNRRQGEIGEAVASLHQMNAVAEARRVEITAALERAYGTYQVASEQITALEEGTLKEAEAALRAAEAAYRFGERGILEVLDAQRVLRTVRLDFLNAQFDRQAALIELEQLQAFGPGGRRP